MSPLMSQSLCCKSWQRKSSTLICCDCKSPQHELRLIAADVRRLSGNRANLAIDSIERLAHVAAFAVSQYASAKYRTVRKPFNPLQGETYELYREDLGKRNINIRAYPMLTRGGAPGLRFISEKVTHHPPRFAAKADGKGWNYSCTSAGKNRLAGEFPLIG